MANNKHDIEINIYAPTVRDRWGKWIRSWGAFLVALAPGIIFESQALQWVGGLFFILGAIAIIMDRKSFTLDEARAELDRIEATLKEGK